MSSEDSADVGAAAAAPLPTTTTTTTTTSTAATNPAHSLEPDEPLSTTLIRQATERTSRGWKLAIVEHWRVLSQQHDTAGLSVAQRRWRRAVGRVLSQLRLQKQPRVGTMAAPQQGLLRSTSINAARAGAGSGGGASSAAWKLPCLVSWWGRAMRERERALCEQPVPLDPLLFQQKLPNGLGILHYPSATPADRVYLRLAVRIGSLSEQDSELGFAHLVEHIVFSATSHFKAGEIDAFLASIGAPAGVHANASTAWERTVYDIDVPLTRQTTQDIARLTKALLILSDFAGRALFLDSDVEHEIRVVTEEWRRMQSEESKVGMECLRHVMTGLAGAERMPIGTPESIAAATAATLKAFYRRSYRPELMTLIVAGKLPDEVDLVATVRDLFGDLGGDTATAGMALPAPSAFGPYTPPPGPRVKLVEAPHSTAGLLNFTFLERLDPEAWNKLGTLIHDLQAASAHLLMTQQLEIFESEPGVVATQAEDDHLGDFTMRSCAFSVACNVESLEQLLPKVWRLFRTIKERMLPAAVIDSSVDMCANFTAEYYKDNRAALASEQIRNDLLDHVMGKEPFASADFYVQQVEELRDKVTPSTVRATAAELFALDHCSLTVQVPSLAAVPGLSTERLAELLAEAESAPLSDGGDGADGAESDYGLFATSAINLELPPGLFEDDTTTATATNADKPAAGKEGDSAAEQDDISAPASTPAPTPAPTPIPAKQPWTSSEGVDTIVLGNGMQVVLKSMSEITGYSEGDDHSYLPVELAASAIGRGQLEVFQEQTFQRYLAAQVATTMMLRNGVGGLANERLMAWSRSKMVRLNTLEIGMISRDINLQCTTGSIEEMLKFLLCVFAARNKWDEDTVARTVSIAKQSVGVSLSPLEEFEECITEVNSCHHTYFQRTTPEQLEGMDTAYAAQLIDEAFSDPGEFRVVIAGKLGDLARVRSLVEKYLGRIPASPTPTVSEEARRKQTLRAMEAFESARHFPRGVTESIMYRGNEDRCEVALSFPLMPVGSYQEGVVLAFLCSLLQTALMEELRQKLAGVYHVNVQPDFPVTAEVAGQLRVRFTCAPTKLTELVSAALKTMARLQVEGPTRSALEDAVRAFQSDMDDNAGTSEYWVRLLAARGDGSGAGGGDAGGDEGPSVAERAAAPAMMLQRLLQHPGSIVLLMGRLAALHRFTVVAMLPEDAKREAESPLQAVLGPFFTMAAAVEEASLSGSTDAYDNLRMALKRTLDTGDDLITKSFIAFSNVREEQRRSGSGAGGGGSGDDEALTATVGLLALATGIGIGLWLAGKRFGPISFAKFGSG